MKILFVCTGNTCRSPMAMGLFRDMMQKRGLADKILCQSAGLSPAEGEPVAENAVLACKELGIDISSHTARKLTGEEIPVWDLFFTMTQTHAYILRQAGVPEQKIYVPDDISDPYGQDLDTYRLCRDKLSRELDIFYSELVSKLPLDLPENGEAL